MRFFEKRNGNCCGTGECDSRQRPVRVLGVSKVRIRTKHGFEHEELTSGFIVRRVCLQIKTRGLVVGGGGGVLVSAERTVLVVLNLTRRNKRRVQTRPAPRRLLRIRPTSVTVLCTKLQTTTSLCCLVMINSNTLISGDNGELAEEKKEKSTQTLLVFVVHIIFLCFHLPTSHWFTL